MKHFHVVLLSCQVLAVTAFALPSGGGAGGAVDIGEGTGAAAGEATGEGDAAGGAAGGEEEAAEGEEGAANEVEQDGEFDTAIELGGGDIKTDTLFPPGVREPTLRISHRTEKD